MLWVGLEGVLDSSVAFRTRWYPKDIGKGSYIPIQISFAVL